MNKRSFAVILITLFVVGFVALSQTSKATSNGLAGCTKDGINVNAVGFKGVHTLFWRIKDLSGSVVSQGSKDVPGVVGQNFTFEVKTPGIPNNSTVDVEFRWTPTSSPANEWKPAVRTQAKCVTVNNVPLITVPPVNNTPPRSLPPVVSNPPVSQPPAKKKKLNCATLKKRGVGRKTLIKRGCIKVVKKVKCKKKGFVAVKRGKKITCLRINGPRKSTVKVTG